MEEIVWDKSTEKLFCLSYISVKNMTKRQYISNISKLAPCHSIVGLSNSTVLATEIQIEGFLFVCVCLCVNLCENPSYLDFAPVELFGDPCDNDELMFEDDILSDINYNTLH